ncbi:hypothetical protein UlMin_000373 [Ulmus minor]
MSNEGHDHSNMAMNPDEMPMGGDLMNTTDMMMKHMSFYWGKDAIILFSGWPNHNLGMYILAFFFVFLLAVAVEILSVSPTIKPGTAPSKAGFIQAGVYAFHIGFAYLVMLSVMSFNSGILIAAVAGHAFGYFLIKARAHARANQTEPKV